MTAMTNLMLTKTNNPTKMEFGKNKLPITMYWDKPDDKYPCFVAKEPCKILGIGTDDLRKTLKPEYVREANTDIIGIGKHGGRKPLAITLPGLFQMIIRSNKKAADAFQRWVYEEVLPSIIMCGFYSAESRFKLLIDGEKSVNERLRQMVNELKEEMEHLQHELDFYKERTNEYMPAVARFAPLKEIEQNQFPRRGSNVNKPVKKQRAKWYDKKLAKIVKTHTIDDKMIKTFTAVVNASVVKGFKLSKLEEEVKEILESGNFKTQITFNFSK